MPWQCSPNYQYSCTCATDSLEKFDILQILFTSCQYTTVRDGALSFPNLDVEKKCSRTSALMHMESKVFPLLHDMKVLFMVLPIPCEKKTDFPEEKAEMDMPFTVKMLLELR